MLVIAAGELHIEIVSLPRIIGVGMLEGNFDSFINILAGLHHFHSFGKGDKGFDLFPLANALIRNHANYEIFALFLGAAKHI